MPYVPAVDEQIIAENRASFLYRNLFYIALIIILILLYILKKVRDKKKKVEKNYKRLQADKKKAAEVEQAKLRGDPL